MANPTSLQEAQSVIEASGRLIVWETCSLCGWRGSNQLLVKLPDVWVCGNCRPRQEQRMREGALTLNQLKYAEIGSQLHAHILDFNWLLCSILLFYFFSSDDFFGDMSDDFGVILIWYAVLRVSSEIFFVRFNGASLGYRHVGLRVVQHDGSSLTATHIILRAFLILFLGAMPFLYLTVLLDSQRRTPIDYILGTRVIYNRL